MTLLRHLRASLAILVLALVAAAVYGGASACGLAAILVVIEVVFSFDNATVNAQVLERLDRRWRRLFLTVGILIAVVGMRVVLPLLIVSVTASISPWHAVSLALQKGSAHHPGTYAYLLDRAHPSIAAFGGSFLLVLALDFLSERRTTTWLTPIERLLQRAGRLPGLSAVVAGVALLVVERTLADGADQERVLFAGLIGLITYLVVRGLGAIAQSSGRTSGTGVGAGVVAGRAALLLFCYLEVLDASFSLDGVIGAFAITPDPIIIMLGLGVGALFVRSLTTYLVEAQTLHRYPYLAHGAHWAILALAVILLVSVGYTLPDVVTGLIGLVLVLASFITSLVEERRGSSGTPSRSSRGTPAVSG